jgi:hypothetical protein
MRNRLDIATVLHASSKLVREHGCVSVQKSPASLIKLDVRESGSVDVMKNCISIAIHQSMNSFRIHQIKHNSTISYCRETQQHSISE